MAERIVYVTQTGSATPTDPTSRGDGYDLLSSAITGEKGDLVTATTNLVIVLEDGTYTESTTCAFVETTDWTTSATYDIVVRADNPLLASIIVTANTGNDVIETSGDMNFTLQDLVVDHQNGTVNNNARAFMASNAAGGVLVQRCKLKSAGGRGAELDGSSAVDDVVMKNCTIIGARAGVRVLAYSTLRHCTVVCPGAFDAIDCDSGVGSTIEYNYGHSDSASGLSGSIATSNYNHTSDLTGEVTSIAYSTANFTNVTGGSEDFSLPAGSALIDAATGSSETEDILGNARSTPDAGAYEYIAGAAVTDINLLSLTNATQASLTSLRWSWFDSVLPGSYSAPTDQGTTESTDGSGNITLDLPNSTLTSGQEGTLVLSNSGGTLIGAYRLAVD
jgi:hypothetical protein